MESFNCHKTRKWRKVQKIADKVNQLISIRFKEEEIPTVEQIQDIVEEALILEDEVEAAKAYILYREQRRRIREQEIVSEEAVDRIDNYLEKLDWEVRENSNMTFSSRNEPLWRFIYC